MQGAGLPSLRQKDATGRTVFVGDRVVSKFGPCGKVIGLICQVQQEIIRGGIVFTPGRGKPFVRVAWEDGSNSCIDAGLLIINREAERG